MASTKIMLLKHKAKDDGTMPLAIRVIKDRKTSYKYLGPYLKSEQWNEKEKKVVAHPNSARINNLILRKLTKFDDVILEADAKELQMSSAAIKKVALGSTDFVSFFAVANERYQTYIKKEMYSVAFPDRSRINNFKKFLDGRDIGFHEITSTLLNQFKLSLETTKNKKGKLNSTRSVANHLLLIRTIFNDAIEAKLIDDKNYPFGKEKEKVKIKFEETEKIGLNAEDIKIQKEIKLEESDPRFHARNKWMFSFYFAGMRISDVLLCTWDKIIDDRLYYRMKKNKKLMSVKIPNQVLPILEYYKKSKRHPSDFIFPDMKTANLSDKRDIYRKLNTATRNTSKHLKQIGTGDSSKKMQNPHKARHSFGNIAGDQISPQMLQKLYNHSNLSTTIGYQGNFIHKTADEALDTVINTI